jgi:hypothetical protein
MDSFDEHRLHTWADAFLSEASRDTREQIAREMVAVVKGDPTIATKLGDRNATKKSRKRS